MSEGDRLEWEEAVEMGRGKGTREGIMGRTAKTRGHLSTMATVEAS